MRCAYHHHLGTVVERQEDLDRFLAVTGPNVGLTVDTGHARLGGIDPIEVIRRHPARVAPVHCKDIRPAVFGALVRRDGSFLRSEARSVGKGSVSTCKSRWSTYT